MPIAEIEFKMLETRAAFPRANAGQNPRPPRQSLSKTVEAWFAFGVDLAPVERGAFFLVAQNFIGGAHLGEFLPSPSDSCFDLDENFLASLRKTFLISAISADF